MNRSTFITIFAALVVGFLLNSFFIVNEKEKAIVFQFGEAVRTDIGVGFHFKLPIIQEVKKYDSRIQTLDEDCLLYTSPSPRDKRQSRMPSSA